MPRIYRFVVGTHESRLRLDRYLVLHLPKILSRSVVQRAIRDGAVMVDGKPSKAHRLLRAGETISAHLQDRPTTPSAHAVLRPESIPLEVVYEDHDVLVVNKPAGLVTHPAPGHWSGTLVNAILWHLQRQETGDRRQETQDRISLRSQVSSLKSHLPRAGIVHRLDKDTSGLLLVAKTALALRELSKQLKARTISRHYLALVEGVVALDEGTIDVSIGRHLKHRKEMAVRYLGGRQAVTHYRVLKRLSIQRREQGTGDRGQETITPSPVPRPSSHFSYTLLEARLETGRTHQIRVHLAHIGHPVLGDVVYSRHPAPYWHALRIPRQFLHAHAIRFLHPTTNRPVELATEIPADMASWLPGVPLDVVATRS